MSNPWLDILWILRPHRCCYCGSNLRRKQGRRDSATVEHLRPLSRNGSTIGRNLALSCRPCNELRGNGDIQALRRRLSGLEHQDKRQTKRLRRIILGLEKFDNEEEPTP